MPRYLLAIDQGTSSTKCLLVNDKGAVVSHGSSPLAERYPAPGWVDQDPGEIWQSVQQAITQCLSGHDARAVVGIGISNQRESCVIWDRRTGEALTPVLSWQDQRTADLCADLSSSSEASLIRKRSGLPLDPMFTAIKAKWLLARLPDGARRAAAGELCVGTIDAWLLSRFSPEPMIEAGNASRTQLLDTWNVAWDAELLELFGIPLAALPRVVPSTGPFPTARGLPGLPDGVPVLAVMGDSHAALFAQGAFAPGQVKATYGTGSSVMGLIDDVSRLDPGVCLTLAWSIDRPAFAAEGNIRAAGATLRWVADLLGVTTADLAELANSASSDGVCVVPAFNGLGAPWWDAKATGIITGLSLFTDRKAIARAALESIPHQVADVVEAVDRSVGFVGELFADGRPTRNDALMQAQADLAGRPVARSGTADLSALGVAHLAGLQAGFWSRAELAGINRSRERFAPQMPGEQRLQERERWRAAVARSRGTAAADSAARASDGRVP